MLKKLLVLYGFVKKLPVLYGFVKKLLVLRGFSIVHHLIGKSMVVLYNI